MTDREQWLKARQDGIGASDAAAALGTLGVSRIRR